MPEARQNSSKFLDMFESALRGAGSSPTIRDVLSCRDEPEADYQIEPMDLANMRANGVRSLLIWCRNRHHGKITRTWRGGLRSTSRGCRSCLGRASATEHGAPDRRAAAHAPHSRATPRWLHGGAAARSGLHRGTN